MALTDYAKKTTVSLESSRLELEKLLRRVGARKAMIGWDEKQAFVAFVLGDLPIKQTLEMPNMDEFDQTETGRDRKREAQLKAWEQACRKRMRAFEQLLKAKLFPVDLGIRTHEVELSAAMCLPGVKPLFEAHRSEFKQARAC